MIIIVCGLPGSGKSFLASRLAQRLSAQYISSDLVRKAMSATGQYTLKDKLAVYLAMGSNAGKALRQGKTVVLDATFHHHTMRDLFIELAGEFQTPLHFILVEASQQLTKKRLGQPRQDSEAGYQVYLDMKAQFEELDAAHLLLQSKEDNIEFMLTAAVDYVKQSHG